MILTKSTFGCRRTTKSTRCLNLGSYNYLGFGSFDEYCTPRVIESLKKFSPSTCSSRVDAGSWIESPKLSPLCCLPHSLTALCFSHQGLHLCMRNSRNVLLNMWGNLLLSSLAWATLQTLLSSLSWLERYGCCCYLSFDVTPKTYVLVASLIDAFCIY